jgi:hypothetical protein
MGEKKKACRLLVGKPLERPNSGWVDNIKMDLTEIGCVVWTGLVWLRIGTSGELL